MLRNRVQIDCSGVRITEQHHKANCDVNNIMRKYQKTGLLQQNLAEGAYGDFTSVTDYLTCVTKLQDAHRDFMSVPPEIRKRFDNDPAKLLAFVLDDENRQEAIELGLVAKPAIDSPVRVIVENPEPVTNPVG